MKSVPDQRSQNGCPLCDRKAVAEFAPFCSPGCRNRDMLRWLSDGYRVPGPPVTDGLDSEDNASL